MYMLYIFHLIFTSLKFFFHYRTSDSIPADFYLVFEINFNTVKLLLRETFVDSLLLYVAPLCIPLYYGWPLK